MSYTERWYYQNFETNPIQLPLENYYLFLDGMFIYDISSIYYFGYQVNPAVYWWCDRHYNPEGHYDVGKYGPLLCKIVEKVNRTYDPENIKINATINKIDYTIKNCTTIGNGNLTITNINFFPSTNKLIVPITFKNESNEDLIYNLSYSIMLQKAITFITLTIGSGDDDDDEKSSIKTGIDPLVYFFTIIGLIIIVIAALTSYYSINAVKRKKDQYRKKIFNKYMDVANLNHIFVKEKKTGLNFYEQTITGKKMDLSLISGFLDAIKSFGIELTGSEEQSQTIKLEYQNSKILMSEFKNC